MLDGKNSSMLVMMWCRSSHSEYGSLVVIDHPDVAAGSLSAFCCVVCPCWCVDIVLAKGGVETGTWRKAAFAERGQLMVSESEARNSRTYLDLYKTTSRCQTTV
jgi:hypothetical protein